MKRRQRTIYLILHDPPADWGNPVPILALEDKKEAMGREKAMKKRSPYENQYVTVLPLKLITRRKSRKKIRG